MNVSDINLSYQIGNEGLNSGIPENIKSKKLSDIITVNAPH
ncbi:hypothetical protein ACNQGX_08735 [Flavobacterium sp. ZB4P13]